MALDLTKNLKQGLRVPSATPTLVLKIDGVDTLFTNVQIKKFIRIGDPDLFIGNDWLIGGFSVIENQSPFITFKTGDTTTRVRQKLDPSRGLGSSVSQMNLSFIDINGQITKLIAPGKILDDIMGAFATIYLGIEETSWPEDFNVFFQGVIESVDAEANVVTMALNNTEERKRAQILPRIAVKTNSFIHYRSALFQDLFVFNRSDVTNSISIQYTGGGVAGSEVVTLPTPTSIQVQIASGVSTAGNIRKALENSPDSNQLIEVEIDGMSSNPQVTGSTTLGIDTTINLANASTFILPADILRTYVKVEDEVMEYTGRSGNILTGVTRAQENSIGTFHKTEVDASQNIRVTDNGLTTALKLYLSGGPDYYAENLDVTAFEQFDSLTFVDNAILFDSVNLERDLGVTVGDFVTFTGAINGGNNLVGAVISEIGLFEKGSYIIIPNNTILEPFSTAVAKFKTPFNTLPIGLGMRPREIDIAQHLFVRDTYIPVLTLDLFVNEIPNGKNFMEKEIYLPMTCYSVPRKGRSSVVIHVGPLPTYDVVTLNEITVKNPQKLKVQRSLSKNFFNQVRYDYDHEVIENEFTTIGQFDSEVTTSLQNIGARPFVIQSKGLKTSEGAEQITKISARRYLSRYERGAESIRNIELLFKDGFAVEIGDVVAVDYKALKLADSDTGDREGNVRLMEVLNKTLDTKNGRVTIDVVNTTFKTSDRVGLISPASEILAGSTNQKLVIAQSFGTRNFEQESFKWQGYVGEKVIVHPVDYSVVYETTILGFDNASPQSMLVSPLPAAPAAGWLIKAPDYPATTDTQDLSFWKFRHASYAPQVFVSNAVAISQTTFEVSPSDINKFFIDSFVFIHNFSYSQESPEAQVTIVDLGLNRVTIDTPTGFNINNAHSVELIGFADLQPAYRIFT